MLNLPSSHGIWNGSEKWAKLISLRPFTCAPQRSRTGMAVSFRARECIGACACFCESKDCLRLCSAAFVAVVQTADLREFNHLPQCWRLHRPCNRRILAESQASARFLIILIIRLQDATQALFVEDSLRGPNTRGGSNR